MKSLRKTVVVCTEKRFSLNTDGEIVNADNTRTHLFWKRYLDVFDNVIIVARVDKLHIIQNSNYVEDENIKVYPLTNYQGLKEAFLKIFKVKSELKQLVKEYNSFSFILRAPGTIANLLGNTLQTQKVSYSIEIVGDPYDVFNTQKGFLCKFLAVKEKNSLKKLLKNAKSAAYVTEFALQKKYPFKGIWQTHYSSINLSEDFFREEKKIHKLKLKIIGIGNLDVRYKGVDYLLDGLRILKNKGIPFQLEWIGSGKLLDEYKELSINNMIDEYVLFRGGQPNNKIPEFLSNNNVFILPSLTEGLPRVLIEAMASRLICIGTNVGGVSELLNKDCIIPPRSAEAIANKLIQVDENFDEYFSYTQQNFEKAKEYLPNVLKLRRIKFYTKASQL